MSEDELTQFLKERGATPAHIEDVLRLTSPEAVCELYKTKSRTISAEEANRISVEQRGKLVESIRMDDKGMIPWNLIKGSL